MTEFCRLVCEYYLAIKQVNRSLSHYAVFETMIPEHPTKNQKLTLKKLVLAFIDWIQQDPFPLRTAAQIDEETRALWDTFYQACDQIYALKPWKKLYEDEIFGIRLPDGEDQFVSIMGTL